MSQLVDPELLASSNQPDQDYAGESRPYGMGQQYMSSQVDPGAFPAFQAFLQQYFPNSVNLPTLRPFFDVLARAAFDPALVLQSLRDQSIDNEQRDSQAGPALKTSRRSVPSAPYDPPEPDLYNPVSPDARLSPSNNEYVPDQMDEPGGQLVDEPSERVSEAGKKMTARGRPIADGTSRPFLCEFAGCTEAFKRDEHLRRHRLKHTGSKAFVCHVVACGRSFARRDNYVQQHLPVCLKKRLAYLASQGLPPDPPLPDVDEVYPVTRRRVKKADKLAANKRQLGEEEEEEFLPPDAQPVPEEERYEIVDPAEQYDAIVDPALR